MKKLLLSLALLLGIISLPIPVQATVSSNITKVIVAGDNITTSVPFGTGGYSVPVYLSTDIQVYTQNVASGTITLLTLNTGYTVALTAVTYTLSNSVVYYTAVINLAGGSSPYGALPTGTNLILNRVIPYTNLLNITNYSSTPATTWNQGYDRATMLAQQLYTLTQQAVLQPVSATSPISIPSASNGYVLCWSGTLLANCANNGTGTPIPIPIPNSDLQTLTTAGLVNVSAITGTLPVGNGGTGVTAASNGAGGVVILNGSAQIPALSGALLTNLPVQTVTVQGEVSGSRAIGTPYQNTTGKAMWVTISFNVVTSGTVTIKSDAAATPTHIVGLLTNGNGFTDTLAITFVVLNNNYYEAINTTSSNAVNVWTEYN